MSYTIDIHRHNFAIWAAARAVQRGFTKTINLKRALECTNIQDFVVSAKSLDVDASRFDALHKVWCTSIIHNLNSQKIEKVTYGRAAKLVAIYLKTTIILSGHHDTLLGRVIHPPIDSIIINNISNDTTVAIEIRENIKGKKWTQIDEKLYYEVINTLKRILLPEIPFWMIEKYWTVTNDDACVEDVTN